MTATLRNAWAMWTRDRDLLVWIAGPMFFLPLLALMLLVPAMPPLAVDPEMTEAVRLALAEKVAAWLVGYGGWYMLASVVVQLGGLVVLVLYLDDDRPDVGAALARAARLFPRYLPAMILTGMPLGVGQLFLLLLLPGLYLFGRMIAVGPILVAEATGIMPAIRRSWALTKGHGLTVAALAAVSVFGGGIAALPFLAIDHSLTAAGAANPVVIAVVDAGAAAVSAAAMLAMALIQVAVYRRLVSKQGI